MSKDHEAEFGRAEGSRLDGTQVAALERCEPHGGRAPAAPRPKRSRDGGGPEKRGFDPYNSGAFDRGLAWSRIGKR
jgi:hypothetical protein